MNGQSVVKGFIGNAIYSGGTLSYFRHTDWLGSVRLGSNTNRQMQFSLAYAPFGETYSEAGTAGGPGNRGWRVALVTAGAPHERFLLVWGDKLLGEKFLGRRAGFGTLPRCAPQP